MAGPRVEPRPAGLLPRATEGLPDVDLIGSWPSVRLVGGGTALLGLLTLAATAAVATLRLRAQRRHA